MSRVLHRLFELLCDCQKTSLALPGWHVDSWASTLHLALSLAGGRRLGLRCRSSTEEYERVLFLKPGDVYLSSPALFPHEVRKEKAEVIAVQLRMALEPGGEEPGRVQQHATAETVTLQ